MFSKTGCGCCGGAKCDLEGGTVLVDACGVVSGILQNDGLTVLVSCAATNKLEELGACCNNSNGLVEYGAFKPEVVPLLKKSFCSGGIFGQVSDFAG